MPVVTKRILAGVITLVIAGLIAWDLTQAGEAGGPAETDSAAGVLTGWALTLTGCGALYWRRRRPVPAGVLVLLCTAAYYPLAAQDWPFLMLAFAFMLYTVAAEGHLAAATTLAAVTMLSIVYGEYGLGDGERHVDNMSLFLLAGWFVGLVAIGHAQRTRQAYLREVEQRALAAEREKEVRARQSATEERLRIARELHDVLGHNISLINVQSAAVLHRHTKRGESSAREMVPALEAIRDTSRNALRELRATLGVLRQVDEAAPTAPADVGLGQIGELTARAGATGLRVRTVMNVPEAAPSPAPQAGLAAYRIVQESLTNIVRHAEAVSAVVTVAYEPAPSGAGTGAEGELRVRVEDDGRGAPEDEASLGSGLRGMAERARALGGELTAGNVTDDSGTVRGFRVEARLPAGEAR